MKIRNVSGRARDIADPRFPIIHVEADDVVDVPAELARSLCQQPDRWEAVKSKTKTADRGKKES